MSFSLYDKAVGDKIKNWVLDPNLTVLYPDETSRLFSQVADQNKDQITLPLISIGRDRTIDIKLTNKRYGQSQGKIFSSTGEKSASLAHIPVILRYQLNIYTRYRAEADEYVRNFVFNIINNPSVEIEIPYLDSGLRSTSFMELDSSIEDNSDIPERLIAGQFTRVTLSFTLKDAQLYNYKIKNIPKITNIDVKASVASNISVGLGENKAHYIGDDCEDIMSFNIDKKLQ